MRGRWCFLVVMVVMLVVEPLAACSICSPELQRRQTIRQQAELARLIVCGTLANARLNPKDPVDGKGMTDLHIEHILKDDPALTDRRLLTLNSYMPFDAKEPPRYLLFFDVFNQKLDPFHGVRLRSEVAVDYVRAILKLPANDRQAALRFYFQHLDSTDPEVATDAFLEFAKASDAEVGQVAGRLEPKKLRQLLERKDTPAERLGVFAFLLGVCGQPGDAELLRRMIDHPDDRSRPALAGILGGYIRLEPQRGWACLLAILADRQRPLGDRLAVLGTIRFYHGWQGEKARKEILAAARVVIEQTEVGDLMIEDLRRWQWWDLSDVVLGRFGQPGYTAPIARRAIFRYALSCPMPVAKGFLQEARRTHGEEIHDLMQDMQFERTAVPLQSQ